MNVEGATEYRLSSVLNLLSEVVSAFKGCVLQCVAYEVIFKVASFFVSGPLVALTVAYFVSFTGKPFVSNEQLAAYFLSLPGLASIILWGVAGLTVFLTEFTGLVVITFSSITGQTVSATRAFLLALRNIPRIVSLSLAQVLGYGMCALPFVIAALTIFSLLLNEHDISFYLAQRPPSFWFAVTLGLALLIGWAVAMLFMVTRWLFAVHETILESRSVFSALRKSRTLVQGVFWRTAYVLVVALLVFSLFSLIVSAILAGIGYLVLSGQAIFLNKPVLVAAMVLGINLLIVQLLSIVGLPLFAILVTKLYNSLRETKRLLPARPQLLVGETRGSSAGLRKAAGYLPWLAGALILLSIGVVFVSLQNDLRKEDTVYVTAHRGSSKKAPENTLSAIKQAIADRADYAEIDVQETADGRIVLLHDKDLMRVAGVPKNIWEITYQELKQLDVGSWFSDKFKDERIATLEQVIDVAKGNIKLNIELKYNGHDKWLAESVAEIIEAKNFVDQCVITSLSYAGLRRVEEKNRSLKTGFIVAKSIGKIDDLEVDLFSLETSLVTRQFVTRAKARGKQIHVWTVNEPKDMTYFMDLRVDNIITDYPSKLVSLIEKRASMNDVERILAKFKNWLR